MLLIFAYLSFAVLAGILANSRGRSGFGYFALSLIVSPLIGIILALALPSLRPSIEREAELADSRVCPHCAERIKRAAHVCRFCGNDVAPMTIKRQVDWPPPDPDVPAPSPVPVIVLSAILVGSLAIYFYFQLRTPAPGPGGSRLEVAAPAPMPATPPFVDAPTGALASPKAPPKDAKPKAPPPPLRITPQ